MYLIAKPLNAATLEANEPTHALSQDYIAKTGMNLWKICLIFEFKSIAPHIINKRN